MKPDLIRDYILKSEQNLRLADAVTNNWMEARQVIVSQFLGRLGAHLKRKLKGWKSEEYGGQFFLSAYPGYYISKPAWKQYSIGIQCGEYGQIMTIGISRETDDMHKLPLHPPLLAAVQKILPMAKSSRWWEAYVILRSPAPDWRKPEVLWRIHKDPAFLTDLADQLLQFARASARIIDSFSKKK